MPFYTSPVEAAVTAQSREFLADSVLSPAAAGTPTASEVTTYCQTNGINNKIVFYTGTDTDTDTITYVWAVDLDGVATLVEDPGGAVTASDTVIDTITPSGTNAIAASLSQTPIDDTKTLRFINGVLDYLNGITVSGTTLSAAGFNAAYGFDLLATDTVVVEYDTATTSRIIVNVTPAGTDTVPALATAPADDNAVLTFLNGQLMSAGVVVTGTAVDLSGFNAANGFSVLTSDIVTFVYEA